MEWPAPNGSTAAGSLCLDSLKKRASSIKKQYTKISACHLDAMSSRSETLIFLHIPKTGGTTLYKILQQHYSLAETLNLDGPQSHIAQFRALPATQRVRYRLIRGHLHFGLHRLIPTASTYITLLRNPIERLLSFYCYARSHRDHYLYPVLTKERLDLKTMLAREVTLELFNRQTRLLAGDEWEDPQRPVTRATLERAEANLRAHFLVVGLLEEFDASVMLLHHLIGLPLPFYTKVNVTKDKPDVASLDAETRGLLEDANRFDLELYEYARELFGKQCRAAGNSFTVELGAAR
jgi:Galactose-3-O-sulfotransferase